MNLVICTSPRLRMNSIPFSFVTIICHVSSDSPLFPRTLQWEPPTTHPTKRSYYDLVILKFSSIQKINKEYKIIKEKEKYIFCSANAQCFSSPHSDPFPCPVARGFSKIFPTPISHTPFLPAVCAFPVFLNLELLHSLAHF